MVLPNDDDDRFRVLRVLFAQLGRVRGALVRVATFAIARGAVVRECRDRPGGRGGYAHQRSDLLKIAHRRAYRLRRRRLGRAGEQRARAKRALLVFAARSEPEKQHLKHELLEWCAQHLGERLVVEVDADVVLALVVVVLDAEPGLERGAEVVAVRYLRLARWERSFRRCADKRGKVGGREGEVVRACSSVQTPSTSWKSVFCDFDTHGLHRYCQPSPSSHRRDT